MTKQQLSALISQYIENSLLSFFIGSSSHIRQMQDFIQRLPAGDLSRRSITDLILLLNQLEASCSDSKVIRVIGLIRTNLASEGMPLVQQFRLRPNPLETQSDLRELLRDLVPTHAASAATSVLTSIVSDDTQNVRSNYTKITTLMRRLARENYYSDRTHSLVAMAKEILSVSPNNSTLIYEEALAILLFALSIYSLLQTRLSPIVLTKMVEEFSVMLLKSYQFDTQHVQNNRLTAYLPSLSLLLCFGLQAGFDFMTGAGGFLIVTFLCGAFIQSLCNRLIEKILSSLRGNYGEQYPATSSFVKKSLSDASFVLGACLGGQLYSNLTYAYSSSSQQKSNTEDKKSQGAKSSQKNTNSDSKQHSEQPKATRDCSKFKPVILTADEEKFIEKHTNCEFKLQDCQSVVYKILGLDPAPKEPYPKKMMKQKLNRLSLFWHPDHRGDCPDSKDLSAQQIRYLNSAREALRHIP